MSITEIETVTPSQRRAKKGKRALSVLTVSLLAAAGLGVAGTSVAQAAVNVSVQTYTVQPDAYQTFKATGLTPNSTLTVDLVQVSTTTVWATETYAVNSAGVAIGSPNPDYTRIHVPDNAAVANNDYRLDFYDAGSGPAIPVTGLSVVAPDSNAEITDIEVLSGGDYVRITGEGFRRVNTAHNSVIGVKLENGAIKHSDTTGDFAPVPKPYPSSGSSPVDVWFYIGDPNPGATGADGVYNGITGFPNEDYASDDISGGSFTVDIPIDTLSPGTYTLRFLTGSLDDALWQSPNGSTSPDVGRGAVFAEFTK